MNWAQIKFAFLLVLISLLGAARLHAQDSQSQVQEQTQQPDNPQSPDDPQQQSPPKPAGRQGPPFSAGDVDQTKTIPDNLPLTGVQVPGTGSQEMHHSYWAPGLQYGNLVRSSTQRLPNITDWNTTSFVAGNLSLFQQWSRSQLSVNYTGGATFSTDKSLGNGSFHELNLAQAFDWRTVQLVFIDDFSYLPQTQFGFAAANPLGTPGVGGALGPSLPALQNNYQPSQTIFGSFGPRYSNGATVQMTYNVSRRSSFTSTASYGTLRFQDPGNVESDDTILSLGYNYVLSKKNTIGLLYRFTAYRYLQDPQAINDNVVQVAYGRKVTGRTALDLFVGPEITNYRVSIGGSSQAVSVAGGGDLTYTLTRTGIVLRYSHGVSGGSGVFTGASSDQVQGSVSRRLSRVWTGNVDFGYARNAGLGQTSSLSTTPPVNSSFIGTGLQRPIGRTATASLAYAVYLENLNEASCEAATCGSYVQHQVSLSVQWHTRPFVLR